MNRPDGLCDPTRLLWGVPLTHGNETFQGNEGRIARTADPNDAQVFK